MQNGASLLDMANDEKNGKKQGKKPNSD